MRILGIDEAGRGCVIGPLAVASVLASEEQLKDLEALGVRDSKQLTRARREALFPEIERIVARIFILEIPASDLAENLTQIELRAMAQIIRGSKPHRVVLDLPVGPGAQESFSQMLRRAVGDHNFALIAENRADARFPIVSAASIIAKVYRDRAIERLREEYGDFGWGYPSEPKTRQFLQDYYERHGRFPACARAKWRTLQRLAEQSVRPADVRA